MLFTYAQRAWSAEDHPGWGFYTYQGRHTFRMPPEGAGQYTVDPKNPACYTPKEYPGKPSAAEDDAHGPDTAGDEDNPVTATACAAADALLVPQGDAAGDTPEADGAATGEEASDESADDEELQEHMHVDDASSADGAGRSDQDAVEGGGGAVAEAPGGYWHGWPLDGFAGGQVGDGSPAPDLQRPYGSPLPSGEPPPSAAALVSWMDTFTMSGRRFAPPDATGDPALERMKPSPMVRGRSSSLGEGSQAAKRIKAAGDLAQSVAAQTVWCVIGQLWPRALTPYDRSVSRHRSTSLRCVPVCMIEHSAAQRMRGRR